MSGGRRVVSALVVLLLVAGVVAGVVVEQDDDGEVPPPESRPAVAPEGSLKVGVPGLPAAYDPFDIRSRSPAGAQILAMVLPQLFDVAPDGTVRGRLAEEGSVETGGRSARFRLAEGARWSDGVPISVDDLRFTLEVIRSEEWPGPVAGYDLVDEIEGEGREVTFRFSRRFPGWQRLFSGGDFVLPRHRLEGEDLAEAWRTGPDLAGGPYTLVGSTPGLDVVLTANPEWWGGGPGVADIQVLTVPDATTLFQLLELGDVDLVWMPAYTDRLPQLEAIDGVEVVSAPPGGRVFSVYANAGEVDADVRVAALDLFDRDRFVKVLLEGEAEVATSWGRLKRNPGWPRWFVTTAGAEEADAADFQVLTPEEVPMARLLVRSVQRRARPTSLTFDAVELTTDVFDGEWLPEGRFDFVLVDEVQWPEPCWECRFGSAAVGETNWARVAGDEFSAVDGLAARADAGDDGAAARLERALQEGSVLLPLWRPGAAIASRGVSGVEANAWSPGPFSRVERWRLGGD